MSRTDRSVFQQLDAHLASGSAPGTRRRGALRMMLGIVGMSLVGIVFCLLDNGAVAMQPSPVTLALGAIPGALALLGVVEIITGIPYHQLARRWDSLRGWQRGVYGTFIVLIATAVIIMVFAWIVVPLLLP